MRLFPLLLVVACLPQVGPAVQDGSVLDDGGAAGGGSGGAGGGAAGGTAGGAAGCPGYAGCTTFTTGTTVTFPNGDESYAPKCLKVQVGQMVTFSGDFGNHPLDFVCGPGALPQGTSRVTLTTPGVYGYYCTQHGSRGGNGMAGAIEVVP